MTIFLKKNYYNINGDNMSKKFKTKKNKKIIKILFLFIIIYIILNFIIKKNNNNIDETIVSKIILNVYSNKLNINLDKIDLKNPEKILKTALNYNKNIDLDKNEVIEETFKENDNQLKVYIYNTHQTEEYDAGLLSNYNVDITVYTASYILKNKLENYNIKVYVEDKNIKEYLNKYGYSYNESYKISREFLENLPEDMDLYIDLHRDSANRKVTAVNIDRINYAKVMFVIGTDHNNYNLNLDLATKLNNELIKFSSEITRGIYTRKSIYNQDYSSNLILLELGGPYNTLEEIENTLTVFASAINSYLGG